MQYIYYCLKMQKVSNDRYIKLTWQYFLPVMLESSRNVHRAEKHHLMLASLPGWLAGILSRPNGTGAACGSQAYKHVKWKNLKTE